MTTVAKGVKALAQEARQEKDTGKVSFDYDGETYEIDRITEDFWNDVEVLEAMEAQQPIALLKLAVGPVNWMVFKSKKRTSEDLEAFTKLVYGVGSGESAAS